MKTYRIAKRNLSKSTKTADNKLITELRLKLKLQSDSWRLWSPERSHMDCFWQVGGNDTSSGLGKQSFKKFLIHVIHNSIDINTHTNKMYRWIATTTIKTGSYCVKNRQTCSKLHHLYAIRSKCPPPSLTKISDVDELNDAWITSEHHLNHTVIERAVGDVSPASTCLRSCWRQTFWAWCKDDVTYYMCDDFCQSCLKLFNDLLKCTCKY